MTIEIRSKMVKIGNSRGIRIPRVLLEQAGLTDEVEMSVEGDKLIIRSERIPRQGWEAQLTEMAKLGDARLLDEYIPSQWDEQEWTW